MSSELKQQLKDRASKFEFAIDETGDITGTEHLAVFIRACDRDFHVYENWLSWLPYMTLQGTRISFRHLRRFSMIMILI